MKKFIIILLFTACNIFSAEYIAGLDTVSIIKKATNSKFTSTEGTFNVDDYGAAEYSAGLININTDDNPEVIVYYTGGGSGMGGYSIIYKETDGVWSLFYETDGMFWVLETLNKGYYDVEIGGPGHEFPVLRWNGHEYKYYRTDYQN